MHVLLVSGLSGAGKSQALRYIEDNGFFCVDNLPPSMLLDFIEVCRRNELVERIAVGVDVRGGFFFGDLPRALEQLRENGIEYDILFIDAAPDVILRRYKETRRLHPLGDNLEEAIREDRKLMRPLRDQATYVIDTSLIMVRQLKERITELLRNAQAAQRFHVSVMSFGYKYGIPAEADVVWDVRFLPNPFHVPDLKHKSGLEADVRGYVMEFDVTRGFLNTMGRLLDYLLPFYEAEGKNDLVVAIGCTGGMHRSVVIAQEIGAVLRSRESAVSVTHRDIDKDRNRLDHYE